MGKEQKAANKNAILQWTKLIKNLRDPLSHPSDSDFPFEDSFFLLDSARRILMRLGYSDEGAQLKALEDGLLGRPLVVESNTEPLEDRLPARETIVVDFVGRANERKTLWEWFQDPVSRRWALAGEGGKGKSAIAFKFGTEVKFTAPEPYQIVLWLSAKRRRFQEGKVISVDRPDFEDLDTALSRILTHFGWLDEAQDQIMRKRSQVVELLNSFPALVIVDDIDTLEGEAEDAIEFFTFEVPQTKSKVLLTSRRVVFGMGSTTTHVKGFSEQEADAFITSRCRLMGLDPATFGPSLVKEMVRVTEGSPLYIEDMMRIMAVLPPPEAIKIWEQKGSNEARQYALGRELELLSRRANEVLVAACAGDRPSSFAELVAVTGLAEDQLSGALTELQRLFLVPKPSVVEGEPRFIVNHNTRALVRQLFGSSDVYRRAVAAHKAVSGRIPMVGRKQVALTIRQAVLLVRNRNQVEAEQLLLSALGKQPNDPDLTGVLGWVYKAWDPSRTTDARYHFRRAWQLKCANEGMYKHWAQMEINDREWTKSAEAAEKGLKFLPESRQLLYLAGYSRGRLARELMSGLHKERAEEERRRSTEYLHRALKAPDSLEAGERRLNADIYRALVLNAEQARDLRALRECFSLWLTEHADDPNAHSEWERLSIKFGLHGEESNSSGASA